MTPIYDVLTAQPSLDARQIERKQMRLAMSVGNNNHYRIDRILARHFSQTSDRAGLPKALVHSAISEIADTAETALHQVEAALPEGFPETIHASVRTALMKRLPGKS